MANWNNPTLTSTYTNFVTEVKDRDVEAAVWFEGMSPTNLPTNAKRLNTSTGRFEKWNGSAWVDAVATFTFPALTVAGAATFNGNTTIGDAGTDTLTVNAAATFGAGVTFNGAATFNGSMTLGDAAADAVTVNATLSFATAPVLTPGTANGVLFLNNSKVVSAGSSLLFDGSNIGLGVTPSANDYTGVIQFKWQGHSLTPRAANDFVMTMNAISSGGGVWRYANSGAASLYLQADGNHIFATATSGTPGATISFTNTLIVTSGGRVGFGTDSPSRKLEVSTNESSIVQQISSPGNDTATIAFGDINSTNKAHQRIGSRGNSLTFIAGDVERARLDNSGNLMAVSGVTGYWQVPRGTTAQRPTGASGMIRFNSDLNRYEGHNGSAWSSIGGGATGGGSDDVFYENGQTVTTNYTLTSGKNAMSAGPVTIASGITVTIPSGSNWAIV